MNAYELADELEWHWDNDCRSPAISKSADMLRQQADRIAKLESYLEAYKTRVAELEKETHSINYTCPNCETHVELFYKTPQIKELSDEEIEDLAHKHNLLDDYPHKFARAILKKASEK